jgi:hypothetical protein
LSSKLENFSTFLQVKDLMLVPSQKPGISVKVLASLGVAVAGAVITSGIYLAKKK